MSALYGQGLYAQFLWGGSQQIGSSPTDDIVFNNYGLQNSNITSRYIKHDSAPIKEYLESDFPRGDGKILIDSNFKQKIIPIRGKIKKTSNALFLAEMDAMKKAFREDEKILKITEGSVIRKYIASVERFNTIFAERDHYNIDWVNYECDFIVNLPFAFSDTRKVYSDIGITANKTRSLVMDGTADGGRLITVVQFTAASSITKVTIENTTNGDKIEVTRTFAAGEILVIDGENQTVQVNGSDVDFSGFPPTIDPGANSTALTITGTSFTANWTNKFYDYYL